MLVSLTWCVPLCVSLSLYKPVLTCMSEARYFSTSPQRWLVFFVCFCLTILPLHAVDIFGHGLPFRWELTLLLIAAYGYGDARGSQLVFIKFLSPLLTKGMVPLQSVVQAAQTINPDSMLCTLQGQQAPAPPPPTPIPVDERVGEDVADEDTENENSTVHSPQSVITHHPSPM